MTGETASEKTVLVTGGGGFIGRHVLQPLRNLGYDVHAVSRTAHNNTPVARWHACDLLDTAAIDKLLDTVRPTHLLHLAWVTEHGKYWNDPVNTKWLDASTHLFRKFIAGGGMRILGIGTCAEYDWNRDDQTRWKETDLCAPHTLYGQTKLELYERLRDMPVSSAWARLFLLFGEDENPERLIPYICKTALTGEEVRCSPGTQIRDFVSTEFCARALAQVLESPVTGAVNIGAGDAEMLTVADVAKHICALCGHPEKLKLGALPMREGDPPFMVPDLTRLRDEVGFTEHQNTRAALAAFVMQQRAKAA